MAKAKKNGAKASESDQRPVVYFYPEITLLGNLDAARKRQQTSMESHVAPRRGPLSRSGFICSILAEFLRTKRDYDKHSDGGWAGYWSMVREAVDSLKTKAKTAKKGRRS